MLRFEDSCVDEANNDDVLCARHKTKLPGEEMKAGVEDYLNAAQVAFQYRRILQKTVSSDDTVLHRSSIPAVDQATPIGFSFSIESILRRSDAGNSSKITVDDVHVRQRKLFSPIRQLHKFDDYYCTDVHQAAVEVEGIADVKPRQLMTDYYNSLLFQHFMSSRAIGRFDDRLGVPSLTQINLTSHSSATNTTVQSPSPQPRIIQQCLDRHTRPDHHRPVKSLLPPPQLGAFQKCRLRRHKADRKPRTPFSGDQLLALESAFCRQPYLTIAERLEFAERLGLTDIQVKIWFQNRRAKCKRILEARVDRMKWLAAAAVAAERHSSTFEQPGGGQRLPLLTAADNERRRRPLMTR